MPDSLNPAATHQVPWFITAPNQTDVLMVIMSIVLVLAILGFGILFFRLHTLPERMAHKSQKLQFEIVAVLGLIALFTHMHIFWIAGLLLALIEFPDFGTPLGRIAQSVETMAGIKAPQGAPDQPAVVTTETHDLPEKQAKSAGMAPEIAQEKEREPSHA
jgi:hypothetical protein